MVEEEKALLETFVEGVVVNGDSEDLTDNYGLWESIPGISIKIFIDGKFECKVKTDSQGNFLIRIRVRGGQRIRLVFVDPDGEFDKEILNLGKIVANNKDFMDQLVKMERS